MLDLQGGPARWSLRTVALTGLADVAPEDPEPEYVDINKRDQAGRVAAGEQPLGRSSTSGVAM